MSGNLPQWPGAGAVYSYLYRALEKLGAANWRTAQRRSKNRRTFRCPSPTEDMVDIIAALNSGDEERLKYYHLHYKVRKYVNLV